jgi:hypothetical protein
VNSYQATFGGGEWDAWVAKLNGSGTAYVWATHLGGNGNEWASGVAVAPDGTVWVVGHLSGATAPTTFPTKDPITPPGNGACQQE